MNKDKEIKINHYQNERIRSTVLYLSCRRKPDIRPITEPNITCKSAEYHNTKLLLTNNVSNASFSSGKIVIKESLELIADSSIGVITIVCRGKNAKLNTIAPVIAPVKIPLGIVTILNVLQYDAAKLKQIQLVRKQ